MALEDRDRHFEKALARYLHPSASSGAEPSAPATASFNSCPDAEILAAYHEQCLSHEELSHWKGHVVSCNNCQYVLAQLAATDKIALDSVPVKDPLFAGEPAPPREKPSKDTRFVNGKRRPPSWRWVMLIPAGAMAAGLVAYISLRTPKSFHLPPSSSVQVAQNQPPQPFASSAKPSLAPPAAVDKDEKFQPASPSVGSIGGAVSTNRDEVAKDLPRRKQPAQQTPGQYSANATRGPSVSLQKERQQPASGAAAAASGAAGISEAKKLDSKPPVRVLENGRLVASPAPSSPAPAPREQPGSVADSSASAHAAEKAQPSAPTSNAAAPKAKTQNADAFASASNSAEVSAKPQSRAQTRAMLGASALQNLHVFLAPDGKHLWRLGHSGSLKHSKDRGVKWTAQISGVTTDLEAGSAPSSKVCWVVGNSGTILRTTDGGAHWEKLNSPVASDLTGVRATDSMHAQISFVPDQQTSLVKTYETNDGGATWFSAPRH